MLDSILKQGQGQNVFEIKLYTFFLHI